MHDDYCPYCRRGKLRRVPVPPPHDWCAAIRETIMSLSEHDSVRRAYEGKAEMQ